MNNSTMERLFVEEVNIDTKRQDLKHYFKEKGLYVFVTIPIFLIIIFLTESLYIHLGDENYITIHLILEMIIIILCMGIANQLWFTSGYTFVNKDILYGALFFFIGLIYMAHTLSYKGMPFFITESSIYKSTWFYMIGRIILSIGMLGILNLKKKKVSNRYRWFSYSTAFMMASLCFIIVYSSNVYLPFLVIEGEGTTAFKHFLQLTAAFLQLMVILCLIKQYKTSPKSSILLLTASIYLLFSDLMFTFYKTFYDLNDFFGHLFQIFGFIVIYKALYYSAVEHPYRKLFIMNQILQKSKRKMYKLAYFDEITQMPNERYINAKIIKKMKKSEDFSIIVFEMERLESIKASLGTYYSEEMLKMAAKKLNTQFSERFVIGKLRGDQFAILVSGERDERSLENICKEIQELFKKPFHIQHFSLRTNVYIGIASFPFDASDEESLMKHAQFAMYEAYSTINGVEFYHSKMVHARSKNVILENDLYEAIQKNELFLKYQPQLETASGKIKSVEALVRWRHPSKGIISPNDFISVAEHSGLIVPLGNWILEKACLQTKEMQKKLNEPLKVSVNLSIGQLYQGNFVEEVRNILQRTGFSPHLLELEITETMTMNTTQIKSILYGLKGLGVSVVIDDFGTGYSSLTYLKDLPIDALKIDRAFVKNIQKNKTEPIVDMILSMAKHLQLKVIAEGIETEEQLSYLSRNECDLIQGFIICEPLSIEEFVHQYEELKMKSKEMLQQYKMKNYV